MCRNLIYLLSFLIVLCVLVTSTAKADSDIVAYWKLDDASGTTAFDSSGNSHDGTLEGDPQWVDGQFLGALEFDGSGDYVNCGTEVSFTTVGDGGAANGYTISVWINPSDPGGDGKICGDIDDSGWGAAGFYAGVQGISSGEWLWPRTNAGDRWVPGHQSDQNPNLSIVARDGRGQILTHLDV